MASSNKSIILVTGGNGGIGLELVAQLLADSSKHVLLGSRSAEKGEAAVKELEAKGQPGTVELLQLDVANGTSIETAAKSVESKHGRLDALVNNAAVGISSGPLAQQMSLSFETNATGPLLMVEAFAPLLEKSIGTPRIVNVSTRQSFISIRLDPQAPGYDHSAPNYRASKAALNMITASQSVDYGAKGFKVFAYCPGFTVSNLSSLNKSENGAQPTREGAAPIVRLINGERDAEHGTFVHGTGQYAW